MNRRSDLILKRKRNDSLPRKNVYKENNLFDMLYDRLHGHTDYLEASLSNTPHDEHVRLIIRCTRK